MHILAWGARRGLWEEPLSNSLHESSRDDTRFSASLARTSITPVEWAALVGVLLIAVVLRCWRLDQNNYGNEYYSAGVWSMLQSWHNFFFNSFDPAGFISVDKPPVAFGYRR